MKKKTVHWFVASVILIVVLKEFKYWDGLAVQQAVVFKEITDGASKQLIQETAYPDWCPSAVCQNSHICQPCRRRFLIVIASGRSASTTLTWMLDSLPGIRMSGENEDLIKHMRTTIENIRSSKGFVRSVGTKSPRGHNPVFPGSFACVAQTMVEVINPPPANFSKTEEPHMIIGFKTVKFHERIKKWELPAVVNFVKEAFPCARIVVNLRSNTEEQAASQIRSFHMENNVTKLTSELESENEKLRYIAELFGDQGILLDSSEWTKNTSSLNQVVEWLGFDASCFFQELLQFNTRGEGGYEHGKESFEMDPKCRYSGGLSDRYKHGNVLDVQQDVVIQKQHVVPSGNEATDRASKHLIQESTPHPDWCPFAVCQNSHICQPCHRRFLLAIATGRSASTTLTWMLDSLPGIRMSGENEDLIKHMRTTIEETRSSESFITAAGTKGPWGRNPVFPGSFACVPQTMVEVINPPPANFSKTEEPHMIIGFKTIRFHEGIKKWELPAVVTFVKEVFPCARIVVNLRSNTEEQAASQIRSFHMENNVTDNISSLESENEKLRYIAELFGEQAILIDSSEWTKNISSLNQVVAWLGFDESCFFQELLEFNTRGTGYEHGKKSLKMDPKCRYLGRLSNAA